MSDVGAPLDTTNFEIPETTLPLEVVAAYKTKLTEHISYVWQAGERLGVPKDQLLMHDQSKWSTAEFEPYARFHQGDKGDPEGYTRAWLHHLHSNPHHWQYWMFPAFKTSGATEKDGVCLKNGAVAMPQEFCLEMVSDWIGASLAYTGTWDMTEWLEKNLPKIVPNLHPKTLGTLTTILKDEGYGKIIDKMTRYKPKST